MGKKMKLPFLLKSKEGSTSGASAVSPWLWPACVHDPKTLSFRSNSNTLQNVTKSTSDFSAGAAPDSLDPRRGKETSFSFSSETANTGDQNPNVEDSSSSAAVIQGLKSASTSRLFFELGETSSILEPKRQNHPFLNNVTITAVDSNDPFTDFRVSMTEIVDAHGQKDWFFLEELLSCYLRVNSKNNHGYIVGAFVDLMLRFHLSACGRSHVRKAAIDELFSSSSTATQCSFTSHLSPSSSTGSSINPCLSPLEDEDEDVIIVTEINS